jgi:hypothetical protein
VREEVIHEDYEGIDLALVYEKLDVPHRIVLDPTFHFHWHFATWVVIVGNPLDRRQILNQVVKWVP